MKQLSKFLLGILIFCVAVFLGLFIYIRCNIQSLISQRVGMVVGRPFTVGKIVLDFPLVVRIENLDVPGLLLAEQVRLHCHILSFLNSGFSLHKVEMIRPVLTLHLDQDNRVEMYSAQEQELSSAAPPSGIQKGFDFFGPAVLKANIRLLQITDGQVYFSRHDDEQFPNFSIQRVELKARNVPLSGQPQDSRFEFSSKILGLDAFSDNDLQGSGVINWPARNLDAAVSFVDSDGLVNVQAQIKAVNNLASVQGRVKSHHEERSSQDTTGELLNNFLRQAFHASAMDVDMNFSFKTRLDQWELRNIDFSGNLVAFDEEKLGAGQNVKP